MVFKRPANCSRNIFRDVERQAPPIQIYHSHVAAAFQRSVHQIPCLPAHDRTMLLLPALATGCGTFVAHRMIEAPNTYPSWLAPPAPVLLAFDENLLTNSPARFADVGPPSARLHYRVVEPADYHLKVHRDKLVGPWRDALPVHFPCRATPDQYLDGKPTWHSILAARLWSRRIFDGAMGMVSRPGGLALRAGGFARTRQIYRGKDLLGT